MPEERLWMADENPNLVCERESCAGPELYARLVQARGLEQSVEVAGVRWERLSKAVLTELGALLEGAGFDPLHCWNNHVEWDSRTQTFTSRDQTATKGVTQ